MPLEGLKLHGDSRLGLPATRSLPLHSIFYIFGRSRRDRARTERLAPALGVELAARRARARRLLALRRCWFRLAPIRRGWADSSRDWGHAGVAGWRGPFSTGRHAEC